MNGASPVPWVAMQVDKRHGLYVGWEFSGLGRISVKATGAATATVCAGLQPEFRTDVEPDETFLVPAAFVGCYAGDVEDGSYSLHRFILNYLRPPVPVGYPDPSLNYAIYKDAGGPTAARTADLLRVARFAHDLGFEVFMPDAMWFPGCGDWRWDPDRFPHGVTPIVDLIQTNGMKMGLWCAWTHGGISDHPDALSVRGPVGHPDWFSETFGPDWKPHAFWGGRLCLACPEAKAWAARKTRWLVAEHKLDYLKHDVHPIVTKCDKTTHRHRYGVDTSYWATLGYYSIQDALRETFPGLVLENCSAGGCIKDFGVIQRSHYTVTTDVLSPLPDRQSLYDSTYAFPPLILQAYTYDKLWGDEPSMYFWRSAMMGAWQIAPAESANWTPEQIDSAKRAAATYKRRVRPILQDVKVFHVLPRPDGLHWDGLFYWSPSLQRGILYVFRPDSEDDRHTVRLRGLEADRKYTVSCEDGSVPAGMHSGWELMNSGLDLSLPQKLSSDMVYVTRVDGSRAASGGR